MDIAAQIAVTALQVQAALKVIALTLQLSAYLFPQQAIVEDGYTYDYIVVGGGSAGSVVAARLSENENLNVLLIEAGDDPPIEVMLPGLLSYIPHSRLDWNYTSQNDEYSMQCHKKGVLEKTRGLMLGGSSGANYMLYVRGCPHDYQQWAEVAKDDTWNWTNVFPYFLKSERLESPTILDSPYRIYHGTDGPIGVTREASEESIPYLEAVRQAGHNVVFDVNGPDTLGYTQPLFTIANGVRQSTSLAYLSPIRHRRNLHVLKQTLATKIIVNENKRATAVEVLSQDGKKMVVKATKEIILSAGVFNSPKLLMLSGIGPSELLVPLNIKTVVDLPVGYNMQDHIVVTLVHLMEKTKLNETLPLRSPHLFPSPAVIGYTALNRSQDFADYQNIVYFAHQGTVEGELLQDSFDYRYVDDIVQILYDSSKGRNIIFSSIVKLHPKSRGRVMLKSADPIDAPLIYNGYFSDDRDLEDFLDYIESYLGIMNTTYFQSVNAELVDLAGSRCSGFVRGSREYWRCYVLCWTTSLYHDSGTCSIGKVVDSRLRVLGVEGLRVVDASVIPLIPSGNINIPVIMIAEKASDFIMETYVQSEFVVS